VVGVRTGLFPSAPPHLLPNADDGPSAPDPGTLTPKARTRRLVALLATGLVRLKSVVESRLWRHLLRIHRHARG